MKIFDNLRDKLLKTRLNLVNKIKETVTGKAVIDAASIDKLEEILIGADIGYDLSQRIIDNVRTELLKEKNRSNEEIIFDVLKSELKKIFELNSNNEIKIPSDDKKPFVILVIGVNGVGKTTTIGKLAYNFSRNGKKVLIAASDTFRAAAKEQLEIWSERANADIVIKDHSSDPSAVTFEALDKAIRDSYDVLLIDTAGRLHNKSILMEELKKLNRTIEKKINRTADEIFLVLDGTSGQNALVQADEFSKIAKLTGLIITKLDGTAKGGVVFQICEKQKISVRFIGVGEAIDDLKPFNADEFISALIDEG